MPSLCTSPEEWLMQNHAAYTLLKKQRFLSKMDRDDIRNSNSFLTNSEAADFLRLSPRTLEKQRVVGGGPPFRKFGRRVLYDQADLQKWAEDRRFDSTSQF